ncbi:hypothetical protein KA977_07350 [Candidatus Dependentiae bacterium]|nr:hypothetical protein [Candidatus Dependentiae bacterium]
MKKKNSFIKTTIYFFIYVLTPFFSGSVSAYTLSPDNYGSISDTSVSSFYKTDYSQTGYFASDTSSNASYLLYPGYIPYLDAGFGPAQFIISGKNTFLTNRNSLAPDTAVFIVYDFDSSPVRYISLLFNIIDRPLNSSGDTFSYTETNDSGEAYLHFTSGDKTGAYILKSSYHDMGTKYISYNTDESELPAKQ